MKRAELLVRRPLYPRRTHEVHNTHEAHAGQILSGQIYVGLIYFGQTHGAHGSHTYADKTTATPTVARLGSDPWPDYGRIESPTTAARPMVA